MPVFPLLYRVDSYKDKTTAAWFKAPRIDPRGERFHGACDLYAPAGTAVLAPEDGVITPNGQYKFYLESYAVEIRFTDGRICRIGECQFFDWVRAGASVKAGQQIGWIVKLAISPPNSMVHFELFKGTEKGQLSTGTGPWFRRADLMDPTGYLDACTLA